MTHAIKAQTNNHTTNQNTPAFTRVDITIAGMPHKIACPQSDVDNLRDNAMRLHESLIQLRQQVTGKSPNNEELLVLHCLDLYDQISELKARQKLFNDTSQRADALLDKILSQANSLL